MSLNNRDDFPPPPAAGGFFVSLDCGGASTFIRDQRAEERRRQWFERHRMHCVARMLGKIAEAHIARLIDEPPRAVIVRVEDGPVLWCRCCQRGAS